MNTYDIASAIVADAKRMASRGFNQRTKQGRERAAHWAARFIDLQAEEHGERAQAVKVTAVAIYNS